LVAVLISNIAQRTPLSIAVLFLIAGFIVGPGVLNLIQVAPQNQFFRGFVELALFTVLFTDGMRVGLDDLKSAWLLPGRALLLGLPLTLLAMAVLAHYIVGLSWIEALLVGAVLSPTDPVFASQIVGREEIPFKLRHLLNVESGINDGLVLPIVLAMLSLTGVTQVDIVGWATEIVLGIILGIAIAWIAVRLHGTPYLSAVHTYRPLLVLTIGLLVYSSSKLLHVNLFLAAYASGITVATMSDRLRDSFSELGELLTLLFKMSSLLILGTIISLEYLYNIPLIYYLYTILVLIIARPVALEVAFLGSRLNVRERAVAAWFGPRGFASVLYGLLVFESGVPRAGNIFQLVAVVIVGSIIAHSSTDVIIARWFSRMERQASQPVEGQEREREFSKENSG
jgi:NhaP-type Na+/H+ or K+/H+ antiporter